MNPIGIRSCYDEGKRCAESLCMDYHRQHGVKVKIIRIFNTYGPRMAVNDGRVVSNFIVQALKGEPLTIYGNGSQTRSFMYIDDLLEGMVRMMGTDDGVTGPINLGNPEEVSIKELSHQILNLASSNVSTVYMEISNSDPRIRCPNTALTNKTLNGWHAGIGRQKGLYKTLGYFRDKLKTKVE